MPASCCQDHSEPNFQFRTFYIAPLKSYRLENAKARFHFLRCFSNVSSDRWCKVFNLMELISCPVCDQSVASWCSDLKSVMKSLTKNYFFGKRYWRGRKKGYKWKCILWAAKYFYKLKTVWMFQQLKTVSNDQIIIIVILMLQRRSFLLILWTLRMAFIILHDYPLFVHNSKKIMLLLFVHFEVMARAPNRIQTNDLMILRQEFYHCATPKSYLHECSQTQL